MGSRITDGIGQAWTATATFVPRLVGFLLVLLVGWLVAVAVARLVGFLLQRVGFDRLVDRSGLRGALAHVPVEPRALLAKLAHYFVLLIALQLAFELFGAGDVVGALVAAITAYLPRVAVALVLVLVAAAVARAVRRLVAGALGGRAGARPAAVAAHGFVVALGVVAALNQLGIAASVTTPLLIAVLATVAGVVVVGVGGGLVRPMQQRWEVWLERAAEVGPPPKHAEAPGARSWEAVRVDATPTPPIGLRIPSRDV
ncbi:mechanosensitive ion channel family protein [Saccharothrix coeruleofusca]|uniref:Uncharacterized protein n=1 Tax=Saccharothrix coeruleofusca TaxID=33919 RepID=A0A918AII5_9PSEU|nr:hypothetical protein [Saccharothrix coeruleofusca]GGP41716.1 hypothetical protein GCM10010185_11210 [Saccharothrix coeruleofusca]